MKTKTYNYNPLLKISTFLNQYHSVESMGHVPDNLRDKLKERINKEVLRLLNQVGSGVHGQIKLSLKNKEYWESIRDTFT